MAVPRAIRTGFGPRRRMVAAGIVAWTLLLVVGEGPRPGDDRWIPVPDLSVALASILGLLALAGWAALLVIRPRLRELVPVDRPRSHRTLALLALAIVVVAILLDPAEPPDPVTEPGVTESGVADDSSSSELSDDRASVVEIGFLALAIAAAAVALVWTRRQPGTHGPAELGRRPERIASVAAARELLLDEVDPRAAVLRAYAGLEAALGGLGYRREPSETPTEHLGRILADLPTLVVPAGRLSDLYEIARFSAIPITSKDRAEAASSLDHALRRLPQPVGADP